jgi:CDP-diacylglycerol--glycerol-3-phosphate 3-phosphatidyltransferase
MDSKSLPGEVSKNKLEELRRGIARYFALPIISILARTGISPNTLTWLGFVITIVAAILAGIGFLLAAGLVSLAGALCDTLDGALARKLSRVTLFGGVLDSTLDRLAEGAILTGILVWYVSTSDERPVIPALLISITIIASFTVSYIRARAEGAGIKCEVGITTRPERIILTSLGLIFNQVAIALIIIAVMSSVTVIQRLYHVWNQSEKDNILK